MIKLAQLRNINTPEEFFNTDKILFIELIHLGDLSDERLLTLLQCDNILINNKDIYNVIMMVGSPHNMFINAKKGIPFDLGNDVRGMYSWNGDLKETLVKKQIFDFTNYYQRHKNRERIEPDHVLLTRLYLSKPEDIQRTQIVDIDFSEPGSNHTFSPKSGNK
jgi:hypothetical protein